MSQNLTEEKILKVIDDFMIGKEHAYDTLASCPFTDASVNNMLSLCRKMWELEILKDAISKNNAANQMAGTDDWAKVSIKELLIDEMDSTLISINKKEQYIEDMKAKLAETKANRVRLDILNYIYKSQSLLEVDIFIKEVLNEITKTHEGTN